MELNLKCTSETRKKGSEIIDHLTLEQISVPEEVRPFFPEDELGSITYTLFKQGEPSGLKPPKVARNRDRDFFMTQADQVLRVWNAVMETADRLETLCPEEETAGFLIRGMDYFSGFCQVLDVNEKLFVLGKPVPSFGEGYQSRCPESIEMRNGRFKICIAGACSQSEIEDIVVETIKNLFEDLNKLTEKYLEKAKLFAEIKLKLTCKTCIDKREMILCDSLRIEEFQHPEREEACFAGEDLGTITYALFTEGMVASGLPKVAMRRGSKLFVTDPYQVLEVWDRIMKISQKMESVDLKETTTDVLIEGMDYFCGMSPVVNVRNGLLVLGRPIPSFGNGYYSHTGLENEMRDGGFRAYIK